jgi:hypothetical protein
MQKVGSGWSTLVKLCLVLAQPSLAPHSSWPGLLMSSGTSTKEQALKGRLLPGRHLQPAMASPLGKTAAAEALICGARRSMTAHTVVAAAWDLGWG